MTVGAPREPGPTEGTGERWGWELRAPEVAPPQPFADQPPGLPPADAPWLTRLAGRRDRTPLGWWSHVRRVCGLALCGGATWMSTALTGDAGHWTTGTLGAGTAVVGYFTVRPFVLPWWSDLRYRRWRRSVLADQGPVLAQTREWARRRAEHDRVRSATERPQHWEPLRPVTTHRVDVYGGDPEGAGALLLSVAGSLLDTGAQVTVVDLSQDGIAHPVTKKAREDHRSVEAVLLPDGLAALDLLGGLSAEDVGGVVAEAVHVTERERAPGGDRTLDATLVEQVCACLQGSLNFTRLHAAVRVVAHQEPCPPQLTQEEYARLAGLLGEGARRSTEARLFRLAAALRRLAALESKSLAGTGTDVGTDAGSGTGSDAEAGPEDRLRSRSTSPPDAAARPGLKVWELSERVGDLAGDLLAHVVFQVLLYRLRGEEDVSGQVVALVGADRFRRTHIERLDRLARRRGVRLVLLFRHLREDAVEVLGGGEAVMFLRLGNAREAEQAAAFIGRDHRLVLSQFTVSRSASLATTVGTSRADSVSDQQAKTSGRQWSRSREYHYGALMDFPHDSGARTRMDQSSTSTGRSTSATTGTSRSEQSGSTEGQAMGYQRVYEFSVEPAFLQSLSPTAFVLVDPRDPGSPRLGDCGPELSQEQRDATTSLRRQEFRADEIGARVGEELRARLARPTGLPDVAALAGRDVAEPPGLPRPPGVPSATAGGAVLPGEHLLPEDPPARDDPLVREDPFMRDDPFVRDDRVVHDDPSVRGDQPADEGRWEDEEPGSPGEQSAREGRLPRERWEGMFRRRPNRDGERPG
ncbi:hypothetical protein [Actinopolymorpha singaporensis]|uniref:Uncharacterized protein n=1 Tax=Actinopolymorpha singaporensis TaxID=117157 RepID=A0A1H1YLP5_9ACTN|nr:hypothetical protein [Actinopolymorpha singaporensis]SDT22363.1 hypothetical protein SAMN04489717_5567 [Actinopolymorpha singaporensis]